ncbi:MAG: alkaline phosphatase [Phycisphaeraceae bacterium]|nr:alkaline phosphatase [Phycisphaeraceae bacterium]
MKSSLSARAIRMALPAALLLLMLGGCVQGPRSVGEGASSGDLNIIIFMADGWGFHQMEAASLYQHGWRRGQIYHQFPVRMAAATYPHGSGYDPAKAWERFEYFMTGHTDSAAAATAMSTGHKTLNRRVGIDPDGEHLTHLMHRAQKRGMAAGVVSSVPIVDATPTGFAIHLEDRWNHERLAQLMIRKSGLDMILAGGHPYYDGSGRRYESPEDHQYFLVGGKEDWERIVAGRAGTEGGRPPWRLVETLDEFRSLQTGRVEDRILGIPRTHRTLQYDRDGNGDAQPFEVPFIEGIPTLVDLTLAGLNILNRQGNGFVIMIEGGAIDWAGHHNNSPRLIEEHVDFDKAIVAAVDWVERNSSWDNTLMIVVSDHECGYLLGPGSGPDADPMWRPVAYRGKGVMPAFEWHSKNHTNQLVPFFAKGIGAKRFGEFVEGIDPEYGPYIHLAAIGRLTAELVEGRPLTTHRPATGHKNTKHPVSTNGECSSCMNTQTTTAQ